MLFTRTILERRPRPPRKWPTMNLESFLFIAGLAILGFLGWISVSAIRADGQVTHCYIETERANNMNMTAFKLGGYRAWRPDNSIGYFHTFEEAVAAAGRLQCPLK